MNTAKGLSNVGIKGKIRQVLILVMAILIGVVISTLVGVKDPAKSPADISAGVLRPGHR